MEDLHVTCYDVPQLRGDVYRRLAWARCRSLVDVMLLCESGSIPARLTLRLAAPVDWDDAWLEYAWFVDVCASLSDQLVFETGVLALYRTCIV